MEAGTNIQKQFAKNVLLGLTEEETHMCIKVFDKIFCFDKFFLSCTQKRNLKTRKIYCARYMIYGNIRHIRVQNKKAGGLR